MGSSDCPIRLLNFAFNLYQQPLLNRTLPTLIFDLSWDALTHSPQEHLTFNVHLRTVKCISLPHEGPVSRPPEHPANDFTQGRYFGWQSSLYAKAPQIDRPLSRSYFKEQSGRLLPSFHTVRYRSACRIYLPSRNGQIARTGLSPVRPNILLAALPHTALRQHILSARTRYTVDDISLVEAKGDVEDSRETAPSCSFSSGYACLSTCKPASKSGRRMRSACVSFHSHHSSGSGLPASP
jgi:hypothetical protein